MLAVAMLLATAAGAATLTADNNLLYTTLTDSTASVGRVSSSALPTGDIVIPSTIDIGELTYTVTAIDDYGFQSATGLTTIYIPNTVTELGYNAFYSCTALTAVTFEEGAESMTWPSTCFGNCTSLTDINIPSALKELDTRTFYGCSALVTMTISEGVETLGQNCFASCTKLERVSLPSTLTTVNQKAFNNCTSITDVYMHATSVPTCDNDDAVIFVEDVLEEATLHVVSSDVAALFAANTQWAFVSIATDVNDADDIAGQSGSSSTTPEEEADEQALQDSLNNVTLAVGDIIVWDEIQYEVLTVDGYDGTVAVDGVLLTVDNAAIPAVFTYGRYSLMVTAIQAYRTSTLSGGQSAVTALTIPGTVATIDPYAFVNASNLATLTIAQSDTTLALPAYAFYNNSKLTTIDIPARITDIGERCFYGCYRVTSVTLNEGLLTIGANAFNNVTKARKLTIPSTVTAIEEGAFLLWDALTEVYSYATAVPTTDGTPDNGIFGAEGAEVFTQAHLHVPVGSTEAYEAADYWPFATIIEGYDEPSVAADTLEVGDIITIDDVDYVVSTLSDATGTLYVNAGNYYAVGDVTLADTVSYQDPVALYTLVVDSIGTRAFANTTTLTALTIPATVKGIGLYAFQNATALQTVTFAEGSQVTALPDYGFTGCTALQAITLPQAVTTIPTQCFRNCTALTDVTLHEGITDIGDYAFAGCTALTQVTIPSTVTTVRGFSGCTGLTQVTMSEGVTEIEDKAFNDCTGLTGVTLPSTVVTLSGFQGCTALTAVAIPAATVTIADNAFYGCTKLATVTMNDSVQYIGYNAFAQTRIKDIALPATLTEIAQYGFYGTRLTTVTLPSSLTTLGLGAFYGNERLTTVWLSDSLSAIGYMTFDGCSALTDVYAYNAAPVEPTAAALDDDDQDRIFADTTLLHATLHVPSGCADAYAASSYWAFASIIEMLNYVSVSPEPYLTFDDVDIDQPVAGLSVITITYDEPVYVKGDAADVTVAHVSGDYQYTATLAVSSDDANSVSVTLSSELSSVGTWVVTIPAALIGNATAYSSDFTTGGWNDEYIFYYFIDEVDTSTGIERVATVVDGTVGAVYTLSGQRVSSVTHLSQLPAGIYIVGGKKVVVK